jgi:hypothetical protein
MQHADKFIARKLKNAFRKPEPPAEKKRFHKAGSPVHCRKCGMTFRSELYPIGVRMIGDVPIPAYRRIVIVCPVKTDIADAHDRFEWIE